jgi:hypothetical protein
VVRNGIGGKQERGREANIIAGDKKRKRQGKLQERKYKRSTERISTKRRESLPFTLPHS